MPSNLSPLEQTATRLLLARLEADALWAIIQIQVLRQSAAMHGVHVLIYRMRNHLLT
jgi:hypothetical protein